MEWAEELAAHFKVPLEQFRSNPTKAMEYPAGSLRIELDDGSFVEFAWAFHIVSETKKTIAVFTEHCGHHLYPFHRARIAREGKLLYEQTDA